MAGKVYIFRGMPGSGKSTEARRMSEATGGTLIIEPDALLIHGGEYLFEDCAYWKAMRTAFKMCTLAYDMGADVIYADVLPTIDDVERVLWRFPGYEFAIFDMPLLTVNESISKNTHRVRKSDLERMAATWQPWTGDISGRVKYDFEELSK